jgi:hypothetical protein
MLLYGGAHLMVRAAPRKKPACQQTWRLPTRQGLGLVRGLAWTSQGVIFMPPLHGGGSCSAVRHSKSAIGFGPGYGHTTCCVPRAPQMIVSGAALGLEQEEDCLCSLAPHEQTKAGLQVQPTRAAPPNS